MQAFSLNRIGYQKMPRSARAFFLLYTLGFRSLRVTGLMAQVTLRSALRDFTLTLGEVFIGNKVFHSISFRCLRLDERFLRQCVHSRITHAARLSPYDLSASAIFGQQGDKSELRGATPDFLPQLSHDACTGLITCKLHPPFRKKKDLEWQSHGSTARLGLALRTVSEAMSYRYRLLRL